MTDDRQERIRQRAHAIWEQAGRPDGAHQQHWDQATAEIDGEESRPKAKAPATGKATKPKAVRPRKSSAS
ncbi:DUF2934 domain-containing protein [Mesorhizobium sp.]|uniref:DUF2934 domain-containing protein n=1 Tax=Mesorhizobium sp. TaxID=1871066 RepID=UPI000FE82B61|nr:DUF2934 domain-containing protein [Mesorhizobium sp.]RWD39252.1 MAG: DUF2934 domain-containing protein [Mesorhizobium sp.]RWD48728.1 MAG: DUF2934 domain-containing protein [Mesorhizobium sp.]